MDHNEQFREDLQTLIELFKKYADKVSQGEIEGMDPELARQFRTMLGNYDMMKNMIPQHVPEQFREPFSQMIKSLINQLREEIGYADSLSHENEVTSADKPETIEEIEEILKKPGLSSEEIDQLLDRMTMIKKAGGK